MFDSIGNTSPKPSEVSGRPSWFTLISVVLITALIASAGTAYVTTRMLLSAKSTQPAAVVTSGEIATLDTRLKQVESALAKKDVPSGEVTSPTAPTIIDVAGNGEGTERPFIRQMTANPTLVDFPACRKKPTAKQRIGCNAELLAVKAGFKDWAFGKEMRVITPNTVAYHIEKDTTGNLKVVEYAVSIVNGEITSSSWAKSYRVAPTVAASHFIGPMDSITTFRTAYLQMYTG